MKLPIWICCQDCIMNTLSFNYPVSLISVDTETIIFGLNFQHLFVVPSSNCVDLFVFVNCKVSF